jgi:hypothetical protein
LSGLSRPEQVVHFYHRILGVPKYHAEVRRGTLTFKNGSGDNCFENCDN